MFTSHCAIMAAGEVVTDERKESQTIIMDGHLDLTLQDLTGTFGETLSRLNDESGLYESSFIMERAKAERSLDSINHQC